MPIAVITGASRGLGLALARALAARGWTLVVDARDPVTLTDAASRLRAAGAAVTALPGDVSDPDHRQRLAAVAADRGPVDLLVNNASCLGTVPLPPLSTCPADGLARAWTVNVAAPLALTQLLLPALRASGGVVMNVSSDAAVEAYPGWGAYGATKAALDRLTAVLAVEEPGVHWYAVDPGDMRTQLHALAAPDEDPAGLVPPEAVVPALLHLADHRPPSGRYRAAEVAGDSPVVAGDSPVVAGDSPVVA
jgi:NAD(P)-dependent dehydrogenase (short-subunit alcohol dehydrogenase family)